MPIWKSTRGGSGSAWSQIRDRSPKETLANREVHENQQFERSKIEKPIDLGRRRGMAWAMALVLSILVWFLLSGAMMLGRGLYADVTDKTPTTTVKPYVVEVEVPSGSSTKTCYRAVDNRGKATADKTCYSDPRKVTEPSWHKAMVAKARAEKKAAAAKEQAAIERGEGNRFVDNLFDLAIWKLLITSLAGLSAGGAMSMVLVRNAETQNLLRRTDDINQHQNDQQIALPEQIEDKFQVFPDAGAHTDVQATSLVSHRMLLNKGIKKVQMTQRYDKDVYDEDGDILAYKGEPILDDNGEIVTKEVPFIDTDFAEALFDASGLPKDKSLRVYADATKMKHNPGGTNRSKIGEQATVAEFINADWTFPEYEVQRPAGVYFVDTESVNTMVLAITRAGKGQTIIEPTIDMWLRERRPNNMIINDPKGELLRKFYVPATVRGYQVVQFNLINPMKTDIYNPLALASQAARENDFSKCAAYITNIAEVFFPVDGGDDPMWANAANNAFKRAAYGMIDFYLEKEREERKLATTHKVDPSVLETKLDTMWGKVSLYNCYQMFVQLSSKKLKNPVEEIQAKHKALQKDPNADDNDVMALEAELEKAEQRAFLWNGASEIDALSLFAEATAALPRNSSRTRFMDAHSSLVAMGAAEKMIASVYGIAITAMNYFTDPTISTLTSGAPSQNVDLGGLSFPRRVGVRLSPVFVTRYHLMGLQAQWRTYADPMFSEDLGPDFAHEDTVSREGWARHFFAGKIPGEEAWMHLRLVNSTTGARVRDFYFHFQKSYQMTLNGRNKVSDPVTGKSIVRDGVLKELLPVKNGEGKIVRYVPGYVTFAKEELADVNTTKPRRVEGRSHAVVASMVRYSEAPKAIFLITPPHLTAYAKLLLILLKQTVDMNFDGSYLTKEDQKPLLKTRYMLDELGNLQSEGHGIANFQTMLSIGLGQGQEFTIILQTLQQLRDVYGESVDKIVQGNAQPLTALIATPDGWITMGDAKVGTQALTPQGTTTSITGVFPKGVRPVYEVEVEGGQTTEAADEHLWEVEIELPEGMSIEDVPGYEVGAVPGAAVPSDAMGD